MKSNKYIKKARANAKTLSKERFEVKLNIKSAQVQLNEMYTRVTLAGIKSIIWYFNKTMRSAI